MLGNVKCGDNLYPGSEYFHTISLEVVKEPIRWVVDGPQESHLPISVPLLKFPQADF